MISLTARQSELLGFIQFVIFEHGVPPTFTEMKLALAANSQRQIRASLDALEERGRIRRRPSARRGIDVLAHMPDGTPLRFIPIDRKQRGG